MEPKETKFNLGFDYFSNSRVMSESKFEEIEAIRKQIKLVRNQKSDFRSDENFGLYEQNKTKQKKSKNRKKNSDPFPSLLQSRFHNHKTRPKDC